MGVKDAIIEILTENPDVAEWATGGIHARRAPPMPLGAQRRRDRYIVVRISGSEPPHTQDRPATIVTDQLDVSVWASSSRDADEGAMRVRKALDAVSAVAADLTIQRIFWRGTTDVEVEDLALSEGLLDAAAVTFEVTYVLP